MVRLMLASIMGAIGYLLIFAGVAERGRWALRPWDALTQATNTPAAGSAPAGSSSSGGGGFLSRVVRGAVTGVEHVGTGGIPIP